MQKIKKSKQNYTYYKYTLIMYIKTWTVIIILYMNNMIKALALIVD